MIPDLDALDLDELTAYYRTFMDPERAEALARAAHGLPFGDVLIEDDAA